MKWFDAACESGIKCDMLIISGHFGGTFFGKSEKRLPLEVLESHSCKKSCDGILHNPQEVFLFGCNTLATKEKDSRTPEEYLQVLLNDGIERHIAEQVVEGRYGALGFTFKARMQQALMGVPHIYGFDSIGPSGKNVQGFLQKYLEEVGDYRTHLEKIAIERMSQNLAQLNEKKNPLSNRILEDALNVTSFAQ